MKLLSQVITIAFALLLLSAPSFPTQAAGNDCPTKCTTAKDACYSDCKVSYPTNQKAEKNCTKSCDKNATQCKKACGKK